MAPSVTATVKRKEHIFDHFEYITLVKFENRWTTAIEVTSWVKNKIFCT